MIVSLPMYDTASTHAANDRLWQAIRSQLGFGPDQLDRTTDPHLQWVAPDLLLSQTCGLPYRTELADRVQLVGTPDYGVEDCPPGFYRSCIVVRRDDPRDDLSAFANSCLARNDRRSQSGWAAIEHELRERALGFSFEGRVIDTGSHAASARAVAEKRADIAALDAVTWSLLKRDSQGTDDLRVLTMTKPTPGLPLITSKTQDAGALHADVLAAIADLTQADRDTLQLKGFVQIAPEDYLAVG